MSDAVEFEPSTGNVFADLGLDDAPEAALKVDLVAEIHRTIRARHLSQAKAAAIVGMKPSNLSNLLGGHLTKVSLERLFKILRALGSDVRVTVQQHPEAKAKGRLDLVTA